MTGVPSEVLTFVGLRTLASYFIAFLLKSTDVIKIFGELPLLCSPNLMNSFLVAL